MAACEGGGCLAEDIRWRCDYEQCLDSPFVGYVIIRGEYFRSTCTGKKLFQVTSATGVSNRWEAEA